MAWTLRPATTTQYSYMFDTIAGQAQAANVSAQVFSEGSSVNGTASHLPPHTGRLSLA